MALPPKGWKFGTGTGGARGIRRADPARWLAWALIAALAVQGARLVWALVTPLSPVGEWQPRTATIMPVAERIALFSAFDPFFRTDAPAAGGAVTVTAMNLKLFGIRMNEAAGGGSAIIAGEDGVQNSVGVGEEIAPGVTLYAVAFDHVVIDRGGVRESLFLDQSVPADSAAPAGDAAPAATPDSGAATGGELNPASLRSDVKFTPRVTGGAVSGIIVQPQGSGDAFRAAGLRPGDVITKVAGRAIGSAADAAALANQLTPGARIALEVERGSAIVPVALFLANE